MRTRITKLSALILSASLEMTVMLAGGQAQKSSKGLSRTIPKTWDQALLASLEVTAAQPGAFSQSISSRVLRSHSRQTDLQKLSRICTRQGAARILGLAQTTRAAN